MPHCCNFHDFTGTASLSSEVFSGFYHPDYPGADDLTRSDKITAQGNIPAGKTKVALEQFSHSLENINVQVLDVFQWQGEIGSPINMVVPVGGTSGSPPWAAGGL